ncbi:MAG: capsular biosynthesis protein CpsI [Deltaproteobacteria bacterium]|nr:MAG: capsular biosynthesis protein CpsI [Deltaproteobacteria bacterium]
MGVLVTGAAGFIGFHVSRRLLADGVKVVGLDNLNDYYDVGLKKNRLEILLKDENFSFVKLDLVDTQGMQELFKKASFEQVINLAAQAGVRYSLENPKAYIDSNLSGFLNILEGCRHNQVKHLIYASSSSVYGLNTRMPFSVHDNVDHPVSLYAASKKANELMAHAYSHLYNMPVTGLRFFTVYGPWGRPDMALFLFTKAILAGEPIKVFNQGVMLRDFTYVDDIVEGIIRLVPYLPEVDSDWDGASPDPGSSPAPYRLYNIGNHSPVKLLDFIAILEKELGMKAEKELLPMQPGDVQATYADVADLQSAVGFSPATPLEQGVGKFVRWYRDYYGY